jgi:hypothetical protein
VFVLSLFVMCVTFLLYFCTNATGLKPNCSLANTYIYNVRFEVFTAVSMKNGVFWVAKKYQVLVFLRSVRRLLVAACVVHSSPIFGHPDEGGARFLRNVGSYKSHMA